MVEVELGFKREDVFVKLAVVEDFSVKPPVVKVPNSPVVTTLRGRDVPRLQRCSNNLEEIVSKH